MTKRPRATQADYEKAYYRARVAQTIMGLLLDEYPQPPVRGGAEQAAELIDIATSLEALTAGWAAEQLAAAETG